MTALALVAALLAPAADPPPPAFSPVPDRLYTCRLEETRFDGATTLSFRAERDIVFHREDAGWRAEVTLRRVHGQAPAAMAAMFEAGMRPLVGRTLVFHLDREGSVVAIDDQQAIWTAFARGIAGMAGSGGADTSSTSAANLAAPLAALSPPQQRAMLASEITTVLAGGAAALPPGRRPVHLPAKPLAAGAGALEGQQDVTRGGDGTLLIDTHAAGTTGPSPAGTPVRVALHRLRRLDLVHGLLADEREEVDRVIGAGADERRSQTVTVTTLTLKVS